MSGASIQINSVTPRIGAEVSGVDLATSLSDRQVEDRHAALAEHQVLFFRNQPIDLGQQKAFGRSFGKLHIHPCTGGTSRGVAD